MIINLIAANASFIVSNDKHLRPFHNYNFPPLKIFSPEEFESSFKD